MTLKVSQINNEDRSFWDNSLDQFQYAHPLNAFGWGKVREVDGWKATYFIAKDGDDVRGMMLVLRKNIPLTGLSIMYAPKGPLCELNDHQTIHALLKSVQEEGLRTRSIFLRIDPNIPENAIGVADDPFLRAGFVHLDHRWSFWNSPRDLYRIDLSSFTSEDDLFNTLDRDARRCVRKAGREGVSIRPAQTKDELQKFYEIFSEFTVGKGFMCRQYRYQEKLWDEFIARGNGRVFLAIYKGEIIGGLICLKQAGKCLAMHMGTPSQYSNLQTYYAYVWESIRWAWENGCRWYSFRGVGTTPAQESFKRKFNPRIASLVGYYDFAFRPLLYKIFYRVEFKILPLIWRMLMMLRKEYKGFRNKLRQMVVVSDSLNK